MKEQSKKAIIIGCGIAGPAMAIFLKRIGIQSVIYEARKADGSDAGVFLGISPNGLNVLKEFLPLGKLLTEYTTGSMKFYNSKNKNIGSLDSSYQMQRYSAETIQIKRGHLNRQIRDAAIKEGIEIISEKKLKSVTQSEEKVTAIFEDSSEASADFLIGCDGIHSVTRKSVFPDAPAMSYTGLLSIGGVARIKNAEKYSKTIHMVFGEKAFFAYAVSNTNEVWWFNNIARDSEPAKNELSGIEKQQLKYTMLDLHKNDPAPISEIIEAASQIEIYPVYDIPSLPEWHKGRVCLIGDAAHATAPHIGQGASLALEDTICLAKCIRDADDLEKAFAQFQTERKERVEKIIKQARKIGDVKAVPNRMQRFFRDLLLGVFVKKEAKKMDWVYSYKVEW
jgi:2-polyprenyl-6-methoxyphenol hydroxylase-like FAD-dependent oxidoreductase